MRGFISLTSEENLELELNVMYVMYSHKIKYHLHGNYSSGPVCMLTGERV